MILTCRADSVISLGFEVEVGGAVLIKTHSRPFSRGMAQDRVAGLATGCVFPVPRSLPARTAVTSTGADHPRSRGGEDKLNHLMRVPECTVRS